MDAVGTGQWMPWASSGHCVSEFPPVTLITATVSIIGSISKSSRIVSAPASITRSARSVPPLIMHTSAPVAACITSATRLPAGASTSRRQSRVQSSACTLSQSVSPSIASTCSTNGARTCAIATSSASAGVTSWRVYDSTAAPPLSPKASSMVVNVSKSVPDLKT